MIKSYIPRNQQRLNTYKHHARTRPSKSRIGRYASDFMSTFLEADSRKRLFFLMFITSLIIILFIVRLFYIQVLHGTEYLKLAQEQQYGKIVIPSKRGEILTENPKTGELNKLATNTTLDLIYIDPFEIPDKQRVAKALAPLLFSEEDFLACKEDYKNCPSGSVKFDESQILIDKEGEDLEKIEIKDARTKEQLILAYESDLLQKISKEEVDYSPLKYGANDELMDLIEKLGIYGVFVVRNKNLIYTDPTKIDQTKIKAYAKTLAPVLEEEENYIKKLLTRRKIRYIPLKRRLSPETSEAIWGLKKESYENHKVDTLNIPHYFKGVVLIPEHWRYYPENQLASTVIGYVDHEGNGQYGIEEKFQKLLSGKQGEILSKNDVQGMQLVFDISNMTDAVDGDSVVLTIDRVVQSKVQELLKSAVEKYRADNGSIIVTDPSTGNIIAMGNYPNFDPNNFGDVYELRKTDKDEFKKWGTSEEAKSNIYPTQPVFIKDKKGNLSEIKYSSILGEREAIKESKKKVLEESKEGIEMPEETQKFVYKNRFGLGSYVNRSIMSLYEPGSVFKPIVMAIGLDSKEVEPYDTYSEYGPIEIDTGTGEKQYIHTALRIYRGIQTMTNAIEQSSNIGMAYVARKLGRELFYKYIMEFGFGDYTYIDLPGEQKGKVNFWKKWPEAQLLTTSFGQGISVTPIQVVSAWNALANGGVLMQPQIIKAFINNDGEREDIDSKVIRRVISEEASQKITGILVSSVENGVAKAGKVKGYRIAGKTGTSQVACSDSSRCRIGRYERGEGTTVTSFAGYGSINNPKFVILVKFERPRLGESTWGENTAAPVFKELAEFLFQYYDIPPDDFSVRKN